MGYYQIQPSQIICNHTRQDSSKNLLIEQPTIPIHFEPAQLPKIDREQIIWFNESRFKKDSGMGAYNSMQVQFPYDEHDMYNPTSSTIPSESANMG